MGQARKRPEHIENARRSGNFDILSAGGVKSGQARRERAEQRRIAEEQAAEKQAIQDQDEAEMVRWQRAKDELARRHQANEHIYPPETYD